MHDNPIRNKPEVELPDDVQQSIQTEANRQASRILKKNHREIERLKAHGEKALVMGNVEQYIYAIEKMRRIYRQPVLARSELEVMYQTSRERVIEVIKRATMVA